MKVKLLFLLFSVIILTGCNLKGVKGSGVQETEIRTLEDFKQVELEGAYTVEIRHGDENKIQITADDNLLPLIKTEIRNSNLRVFSKKDLNPKKDIVIKITTKILEGVIASGASSIKAKDIDCEDFEAVLSGAGNILLYGNTENLEVVMSGAGSLESRELIADNVSIVISGACGATVYSENVLDAVVSGVGTITYYGNPEKVNSDISGVGSISRAKK